MNVFSMFLIVFAVLSIIIIINHLRQKRQIQQSEKTVATITGFVKKKDFDGDAEYYPQFEFTVQGKTYKVQSNQFYAPKTLGKSKPLFTTGDTVNIHYNPDNPIQAEIDDPLTNNRSAIYVVLVMLPIMYFVFDGGSFSELYQTAVEGWSWLANWFNNL